MIKLKKLHHSAYRCKDTFLTKKFYVNFLDLKLSKVFVITNTKTNRNTNVLHSFYSLRDNSSIAFFEDPETSFNFKNQRDFDLHIAFEVTVKDLEYYLKKAQRLGINSRGISDHGFIKSVYFRDPNGYVIELAAPMKTYKKQTVNEINKTLQYWKSLKRKL